MTSVNPHRVAATAWTGDIEHVQGRIALEPGMRFGRYRVLERRGAGGMGVVFAAHDEHLDRRVALKVLRDGVEWESSADRAARLIREARAMARLDHPNIVAVHDVGVQSGHVFVTMDLVEGSSLTVWTAAHRGDWRAIVRVFIQAGRGLAAAHAGGLVHRDFKPDNVLVGRDGRVRVTDFGLARSVGSRVTRECDGESSFEMYDDRLTDPGFAMGTVPYMAPEQGGEGETDPRSDQFSFCVALYEALWGQRPFRGRSRERQLVQVRRGRVRSVPSDPWVPLAVRRVVFRGLAADPDARWPSMRALVEALKHAANRGRRWSTDSKKAWVAGFAVAGLGLGCALVSWSGTAKMGDCDSFGPADPMSRMWSMERRSEIRDALRRESPRSANAWMKIDRRLDDYAHRWSTGWSEACTGGTKRTTLDVCSTAGLVEFEAAVRGLLRDGASVRLPHQPPADVVGSCEHGQIVGVEALEEAQFDRDVELWSDVLRLESFASTMDPNEARTRARALQERAAKLEDERALVRIADVVGRVNQRATGFELPPTRDT